MASKETTMPSPVYLTINYLNIYLAEEINITEATSYNH